MKTLSPIVLLGIFYSLGYMFYMSLGLNHPQNKKPFRKLFDNSIFIIHIMIQALVGMFAYYRCLKGSYGEAIFMAPLFYLVLLRLLDPVVIRLAGRHIYFVGRGDARPKDYKWYLDAPIGILIVLLPMLTCLALTNYFHFGYFRLVSPHH